MSNMLVHELRNPLSAILGAINIVRLPGLGDLSHTPQEILGQASTSGRRMNTMLNDLLTLGKLEEGKFQLEPQRWDPYVELPLIAAEMQLWAEQSGHHLRLAIAPDVPTPQLDTSLITCVISNLIGNALRHTPSGSTITLGAAAGDANLVLRVADNGPGIAQRIKRVFGSVGHKVMDMAAGTAWACFSANSPSPPTLAPLASKARRALVQRLLSHCPPRQTKRLT